MGIERRCYVCNAPDEVDRHHVLPVEYGGPRDGKTVDLCTRHHRVVHRAAESYAKTGEYTKNYLRLSTDTGERQRAEVLVRYILYQKREHEDSGKALADDARNMVQVSCTPDELMVFHAVKKGMGQSSLARAIKLLVMKEYQKQLGVKDAALNQGNLRKSSPADNGKPRRRSEVRSKRR